MNIKTNLNDYVLDSSSDEYKVILARIQKEIDELVKESEAKLLLHDGKIAECCRYLKDNLTNSIRCVLLDMDTSGELDKIINESVIKEYYLIKERINHFVSVKEYGIKGDGITDDTTMLKQAIATGADLLIPEGCHIVVSEALNITQNIKGYPGSSIKQKTKRSNIFNLQKEGITIEGVTLLGTGEGFASDSVEGAGTLIKSSGKNITIRNCTFKDANYVGCFIDPESTHNIIENCMFINCWAEGISVQSDNSKVLNCYFEKCSYNGCVVRGANHVMIDGCEFIDCSITDVALDLLPNYDKSKYCTDCTLSNNKFKNTYICISLYGTDVDNHHENIVIKGNTFNGRTNSEVGVRIYYSNDIKVTDNTFNRAGTLTSLLFSGCRNVICDDNIMMDGSLAIDCSCEEMANIKGNTIKNFNNIAIRPRTYKAEYNHNFIVANNNIVNCGTGIKTEGNFMKSVMIEGNSFTSCSKDLEITGASDIFVLTNNNFNINRKLDITATLNTFIKANNSIDKRVCSSSTRPVSPVAGDMCFDTSVNKPIWYTGTNWIDSTGTTV